MKSNEIVSFTGNYATINHGLPKTRKFRGKRKPPTDRLPDVRHGEINGKPCAHVELFGTHGAGKEMILDTDDLGWVLFLNPWWTLVPNSSGKLYVSSWLSSLALNLNKSGLPDKDLRLARVIMEAPDGHRVFHRNGNSLDLRRSNLEVLSLVEALARIRAMGVPV